MRGSALPLSDAIRRCCPRPRRLRDAALAGTLALTTLAGCASLDAQQREWIFQPPTRTWAPGAAERVGADDVWIDYDSADGERVRLHGLWLPAADARAPAMLYLHGARWDVTGSAARMQRMRELGFHVLGIDYRGFGLSSPALPSQASALEDARAAWRWLAAERPGAPRVLFGHSLGGAIAVHLAAEVDDDAGLIVEGGFTSIADVARTMRWGWLPFEPLITQPFDAASRIAHVKVPLLVVHGSRDALIRPELGRALYERAAEPKRFVLVDGGSHHSTNALAQDAYRSLRAELFGTPAPGAATRAE